ncbi:hypothetical protein PPBDW_II0765 [Photobacterium kishitanii]|nr:hypothetical protein PPBDW_II0765 [Photobacterium kishitanii]
MLTRLPCVVKRTGLAIPKISATLGVTDLTAISTSLYCL